MNQNPALAPDDPGPDVDAAPPRTVSCPMCHMVHPSLTPASVAAGEDWRCSRCGQRWDAERLATVAAYADWMREHERVAPATHLRIIPGGK